MYTFFIFNTYDLKIGHAIFQGILFVANKKFFSENSQKCFVSVWK
jgi:hypothetical protein